MSKVSDCIRQVANWSAIVPEHKFDKRSFSSKEVLDTMSTASPKMEALFKKIEQLDAQDMQREGKHFKHMIFSDVKTMGYGAKILMAGFLAKGYHAAYDGKFTIDEAELQKHKGKNVALLCSTAVYDKPIGVRFRKALLSLYNQRPDNINGDLIRFIILDQGFKEGIDLFDVKYVHLFEPLITKADEKQAIGRGTRFCGQKGLEFHPTRGWPLHVIRYDVNIPDEMRSHFGADTLSELYLQKSGVDMRALYLANELEKVVAEGAVDAELTEEIHHFSIDLRSPKADIPRAKAATYGGGKKKRPQVLRSHGPRKIMNKCANTFGTGSKNSSGPVRLLKTYADMQAKVGNQRLSSLHQRKNLCVITLLLKHRIKGFCSTMA